MKRWYCAALALLAVSTVTACGSGSATASPPASSMAASAAEDAVQSEQVMLTPEGEGREVAAVQQESGAAAPTQRKLVKDMVLSMETKTFDDTLAAVKELIVAQGGYLEHMEQYGGSSNYRSTGSELSVKVDARRASLTARIPVDKLDGAAEGLSALGNVIQRSESVQDITDTYYDADAHLKTLRLQEERLLEILSKAEKLEDVITLESALSQVRYEIESLTAQLRRFDSQVSYSTLRLDLEEVSDLSVISASPASLGDKLSLAAGNSLRLLRAAGEFLLIAVVSLAPLGLVIAAIVFCVLWILRQIRRRRGPKAPPPSWPTQPPPPPPPSRSAEE